jgi:rhamnosyltransferase
VSDAKGGRNFSIPACSVVIRAYNEEKDIGRLLTGIFEQSVREMEVILVDSGSTDATIDIASQYPVKVISIPPEEFSFGFSLNQGIAAASSVFVVIVSAHVYPIYPDWIERLLIPFEDPQIALAYGKQRGHAGAHFSENQIFAHWFPELSTPRQSHPFCNNANAAIRRDLWENHAYDETLTGLEDLEWAHWAMEQGYAIAYVAEAEVVHVHRETPRGIYNRYRREAMAFKRIFPQDQFTMWDFLRLCASNIASDLWHAAEQRKLLASLASIYWFRTMQFWGTYQGFRHSGPLTWQLRKTFYYPRRITSAQTVTERDAKPILYNE